MSPKFAKTTLLRPVIAGIAWAATIGAGHHPPDNGLLKASLTRPVRACAPAADGRFVAATANELRQLAHCAPAGATIALKPGNYGRFDLSGGNDLTIVSQDKAAPARFEFLGISSSDRIKIARLRFTGNNAGLQFRLTISGSRYVEASDLDFPGTPGRLDDVSMTTVLVRGGSHIELNRLKISGTPFGISYLDVAGLAIKGCSINNVRSDGMRGGGVSDLLIAGNRISGFHPAPGDHPDGIQVWTANQKAPARNIRIIGNLITRGDGDAAQGIFIRDETGHLPYDGIEISGNLIIGSLWNGIAVSDAANVRVTDNTVLELPGQTSWILMKQVRDGIASGNRASVFKFLSPVHKSRNRSGPIKHSEIEQALGRWKQAAIPDKAQ